MIIGIGHVKGVGKDTAADALVRDLGFRRDGFADDLKALALAIDPLIVAEHELANVRSGSSHLAYQVRQHGWEYVKRTYPEARRFLQNLGSEMREMFGDEVWIRRVRGRLSGDPVAWEVTDDNPRRVVVHENVVIPDVRFLNEALWVRRHGGLLVRIDRPGYVAHGHVSETELAEFEGWDATFQNDGDIIFLQSRVVTWASQRLAAQTLDESADASSVGIEES